MILGRSISLGDFMGSATQSSKLRELNDDESQWSAAAALPGAALVPPLAFHSVDLWARW